MKKKLYIILIIILGSISIVEIIFRIAFYEQLKTQNTPAIFQPDTISGFSFIPNSEDYFITPGVYKHIRINNKGFIGDDIADVKSNNIFRILLVGASNIAGNNMSDKEDMSQLLDKYFKEEGDSVEVYNCALVGTGSDYGLYQIIKYKLNDLNPDLVLFNCNIPFKVRLRIRESYHGYVIDYPIINKDVGRKKMLQELEIINKARVLRFLYDKSYIVRGIARRIYYDQYFSTKFRNRLWLYVTKKSSHYRNWYDLAPTTKTTIKLLKELDNLKFDVCLFDFFGDTKLKKCCEDNNIPLIFLNCRFSNEHQQKYDGHMNGKGHKLVADSLYVCLRNSYIPTKFLNAEK